MSRFGEKKQYNRNFGFYFIKSSEQKGKPWRISLFIFPISLLPALKMVEV